VFEGLDVISRGIDVGGWCEFGSNRGRSITEGLEIVGGVNWCFQVNEDGGVGMG
jgi:hypothetical protein